MTLEYSAVSAQEQCNIRKERYGCNRKFTFAMQEHIRAKLNLEQWSPQQIEGWAKLNNIVKNGQS